MTGRKNGKSRFTCLRCDAKLVYRRSRRYLNANDAEITSRYYYCETCGLIHRTDEFLVEYWQREGERVPYRLAHIELPEISEANRYAPDHKTTSG